MDMFFDAVMAQADPAKIKSFAKDGNNQWADQDSAAARVLAEARRQGEAIPTAEKFATITATLAGGEYPWTDIYQAYHRFCSTTSTPTGPTTPTTTAARNATGRDRAGGDAGNGCRREVLRRPRPRKRPRSSGGARCDRRPSGT